MTREELDIVQEIFKISMHSIMNEELAIKQERFERYTEQPNDGHIMNGVIINVLEMEDQKRCNLLGRKKEYLFDLLEQCKIDKK